MKKMCWKKNLVILMTAVSLSGLVGCQTGKKDISSVGDGLPGTSSADGNRIVASMGSVSLSHKQVISYLQSLDAGVVTGALSKEGGLENLMTAVALRRNVVTRAANEGWLERADIKLKIADAQRNMLYGTYLNAKSEPPAGYPDDATVAKVYAATNKQQLATGKAALKPLKEVAGILKQRLRATQKERNQQAYLNNLITNNPISVDMNKLVGYLKLSQQQKQQQAEQLKQPVARMGDMGVSLELALKTLRELSPVQQQRVLKSTGLIEQVMKNLAIKYFVLNEAIAAKFNNRQAVNNKLEQARLQVIYNAYMQAWSAPESGFPSAVLVKENYEKNLAKLSVKDRYHLAKIIILNSSDTATDKIKASQVVTAARASGADFAALAKKYSQEAESAKTGGDVGWINTDVLLPELSQLIRGNKAGTVIGPVGGKAGWQIIKILEHQAARTETLEEARPALVTALRERRMAEKQKQVIEQLLASEPVTIDKAALKKLRKQISA